MPVRFISGIGVIDRIVLSSKEVMEIVQYVNVYKFVQKNIFFYFQWDYEAGEFGG